MPPEIGELPDPLSKQILQALSEDSKFDLPAALRGSDLRPEQVACQAAVMALTSSWHKRMEVVTRDHIARLAELAFTPPEREAPDPLLQAAQRATEFDPWVRHQELHAPAHVTFLEGAGPTPTITYREAEPAQITPPQEQEVTDSHGQGEQEPEASSGQGDEAADGEGDAA